MDIPNVSSDFDRKIDFTDQIAGRDSRNLIGRGKKKKTSIGFFLKRQKDKQKPDEGK